MAQKTAMMGLVLVLATALWAGTSAQSSCTNTLISLSPCLNYITGNSSTPSQQCCSQLRNVVRSSPECLCQALNGGASLGVNVNQTQALALPGACNVQTPPASRCNAASPTGSPAGTPQTPGTVPSGGEGGSGNVPSTGGDNSSDGSSIKLASSLLIFVLAAASYSSILVTY